MSTKPAVDPPHVAGGIDSPSRTSLAIALLAALGISAHLLMRFVLEDLPGSWQLAPLWAVLGFGGAPLLLQLFRRALRAEFSSDLLAGISIATSVLLEEYLAGSIVVLMLSGGEALEKIASARASSVLSALARRVPTIAHRRTPQGLRDIPLSEVKVEDELTILPHEICPVDGVVIEGHGRMDESFLTGEPFEVPKSPGSPVISGAQNKSDAFTIRAKRLVEDSRYARIMRAMEETRQQRVPLRRLGDQLGAWYTPVALLLAVAAWLVSANPTRFLAVLVTATPCPLLIAIPIAIIGSVSLAARRGIIIRDPAVLETLETCRVIILDKTGTLTYGRPSLDSIQVIGGLEEREILELAATLEQYSRHPLAVAVLRRAQDLGLPIGTASEVFEPPGRGLRGLIQGRTIEITSRKHLAQRSPEHSSALPPQKGGLECIVCIDDLPAAHFQFRDLPRPETQSFILHLERKHRVLKTLLVSGDRKEEVQYLADTVGIKEVHGSQSPEQKVAIVAKEQQSNPTLFVGDGINDAPALQAAHVGIAFGSQNDITVESAGAVILEPSLAKLDELFHISRAMRRIALQSAVGGMCLSIIGMLLACFGLISPVNGAVLQEAIDLVAVLNALRASAAPRVLRDFESPENI